MIDPSSVTILIPHLGGTAESEYALDQCLQSLRETAPDIRVMVGINGARCINHRDKGQADIIIKAQGQELAVNAMASNVNTPWILVTNDDMIFSENWFEKLTAPMTDDMLCVSPKLIEPRDGAPTFEVYFCGGAGGDFDKQKWLEFAKNYNPMYQDVSKIQPKGLCRTGFNLPYLIRKDLWNMIGGYNVAYSPWGSNSDSDLQAKIHLAGVQPYQNTNSIVYHFSQTSGTGNPDNRPYWQKNWDYFISWWGFERQSSPKVWFSQDIIDYGRLKFHPWWEGHYAK